jgi:hypothetical protein
MIKMMKKIISYLTLLLIVGIFSGCIFDSKELKHYKNGGTLLCKIDKWFKDDIFRNVNNSNSSYKGRGNPQRNPHPAGFEHGDLFFDIDDCVIK